MCSSVIPKWFWIWIEKLNYVLKCHFWSSPRKVWFYQILFESIQKILALPDETKIFVGHDYKAPGRDEYSWETTVGEQRKKNVHIGGDVKAEAFVKLRDERDAKLAMPKLIVPSLQINMRAGNMPPPDEHGDVFLKLPINKL